ncbi:cellulase [Mycena latifolia]|nr:cellulase [Mycena latifolia]
MLLSFGTIGLWLCLATTAARAAVPAWTPPLSTRGRYVVDANGNRFKLKGGNWHGASGTYSGSGDINDDASHHASENAHTMPLALQYVPIAQILDSFEEMGINTIRLQWSSDMIHDTTPVQDAWVAANPQFRGMTPLQVYDAVIEALTDRGFAVIVNNHTKKSLWCCGIDGNERWNESQDINAWVNDWLFVVNQYKNNKRVVGADLYNKVRRDILTDPNWGSGDSADWQSASQVVADRIQSEANPDILIIVEGINWIGLPVNGLAHSCPTLTPVRGLSHTLLVSNKLVYAVHFYGYTGPNHSGATGVGETTDPRYRDFSRTDLFNVMTDSASYVALTEGMHYTAPVWMSEFGIAGRGLNNSPNDKERLWFQNFVDFLVMTDADYAFWPLVGYLTNGAGNRWALMNWDATGKRTGLFDGDDWRAGAWNTLTSAPAAAGQIALPAQYKLLTLEHTDFVQSLAMRRYNGDFDNGVRKGACPDGMRLIGLSHALCTDARFSTGLWAADRTIEVVFDQRHISADWASSYTKYECAAGYFMMGYGIRGVKVSTVLCAKVSVALGTSKRTVWFDWSDDYASTGGGDFASGQYKGGCTPNEYVGGIALGS